MSVCESSRYAVHMNRYFLIPISIWPLAPDANFFAKLLQIGGVVACYLFISFLMVPLALHTLLEEPNPAIQLKLIGPLSFNFMAVGKYCSLVSSIREFGKCFQHVEEDWKFYTDRRATAELLIMRNKAKVGHFLTLLCAAFMYGGGFSYHVVIPISAMALEKMARLKMENTTDLAYGPRPMTLPVYEHWMDVVDSPRYEIAFMMQCMSAYILYTITVGTCSLAAGFVVHVCAQLEIVMRLLDDFVRGDDAGSGDKMKEIVEKHIRALSFAKRVEKNLNVICFIEFIGCTLNICFIGYYFITEWESRNTISIMTYTILLISFTFNIFIFCYIGETLTDQCEKVSDVTYAIDWYKLPGKKPLEIILIINISRCYPARITAGKMVYLSMNTFCSVMKTAATYMNMLRTLMV